jgi:hypothetical protein
MNIPFTYPGLQAGGKETPPLPGFSLKQYPDKPKPNLFLGLKPCFTMLILHPGLKAGVIDLRDYFRVSRQKNWSCLKKT